MSDQRFTADELRNKHADLQLALLRDIGQRVREFQRTTGLCVQSIDVELVRMRRIGEDAPAQMVVESVDVRVGLGR